MTESNGPSKTPVKKMGIKDRVGILDPEGAKDNPLTGTPYSEQYRQLSKSWAALPAYSAAGEVLKSLEKNQLLIVVIGTGAGKTVLMPKFALHYVGYSGKVATSLPKRAVTLSAASYAALTLDVTLGNEVGYIYRGAPREMGSEKNKIVYLTDGSLIMKMIADPLLNEYDVVIIDEAHERKTQIDILLLFLKKIMEKRKDFKVIIMSATIDHEKYKQYYSGISTCVINISGNPNFDIDVRFLDSPTKSYLKTGLSIIEDITEQTKGGKKKDILFFMITGNDTIATCKKIRSRYPKTYCVEVYAGMDKKSEMHATSKDKYMELGDYDRKVIIATNLAESSLTIDGLKFVVDGGYELYNYYDPEYMCNILENRLITKAQALQRRGRVGRTEPGTCYHLLTEKQFESLEKYPAPDILRQDVTLEILKFIMLSESRTYSEGFKLLQELMDAPTTAQIDATRRLYTLYDIVDNVGKITNIGIEISQFSVLPLNQSLFLIFAYQMLCPKEAAAIIGMMDATSGRLSNLFVKSSNECEINHSKMQEILQKFNTDLVYDGSDHITLYQVLKAYKESENKEEWAKKYFINQHIVSKASYIADRYIRKITTVSKAPPLEKAKDMSVTKRIMGALKASHRHLVAHNMLPVFPPKKHSGQINKDSVIMYGHKKSDINGLQFIYDNLTCVNGSWEYNIVSIL